jgi:C4-dicarboxylate transporter DctM subunit
MTLGAQLSLFIGVFVGVCVLFKLPVAFGLGCGGFALILTYDLPITQYLQATFSSLDSFPYLAIPFFIFAGTLMEYSGISTLIIDWAEAMIGKVRGGIGAICTIACAAFGLLTGSATSTLSAIGKIMINEMKKRGYSASYAGALAASTGFLGILIPPSGPAIIYALIAGCSITSIWMSTVVPGIVIMVGTILINYLIQGRKEPLPDPSEKLTIKEHLRKFGWQTVVSFPALVMPILVFGGIYSGVFTPTEAGAICCVYGIMYYFYRRFKKKPLGKNMAQMAEEGNIANAAISLLTIFSLAAGRIISVAGIDVAMAEFVLAYVGNKHIFLVALVILLLFLGMIISNNAIILIVTPLLLPSAIALGIDAVHFGAILMVATVYGNLTPPFATAAFIAANLSGAPFTAVIKDAFPYLCLGIIIIFLTAFFPQWYMWLPAILG